MKTEINKKINIVIFGNGMFVSGRNTNGFGTVMPAILEFQKQTKKINKVFIIGTNHKHSFEANSKINKLTKSMGIKVPVYFYPSKKSKKNQFNFKNLSFKYPTCAIVSVPDHLHYKITLKCLKKKLHTLVVKPLTLKTSESKKLSRVAKKNNLLGIVEFHKRLDKQNLINKNLIQSNQIGDILYSVVEYSQRKVIPLQNFKKWATKTNVLQYLGVHYIDLMYFLTKAKPVKVLATGQKNYLKKNDLNTYDSIQCLIEWKLPSGKKFTQSILTNWIDPNNTTAMSDQKIKIIGTKGRIESDQKNRGMQYISDNQHLTQPNPDFCYPYKNIDNSNMSWKGYGIDSVSNFLKDVVSIINKEKTINNFNKSRSTFSDSIISTAVIESATKSLDKNSIWIKVKY